jgi:Putative acetyl-transferase
MGTVFILTLIFAVCICSEAGFETTKRKRSGEDEEDSGPPCFKSRDSGKPLIHIDKAASTSTPVMDVVLFISYPEKRGLNMLPSLRSRMQEVLRVFVGDSAKAENYSGYIVAQFLSKEGELMANVFMRLSQHTCTEMKEESIILHTQDVIEIYAMCVSPKYKGKNLSMALLKEALGHMLGEEKIEMQNTFLALYICPQEKEMEATYALYRGAGFTKAALTTGGLHEYIESQREKKLMDLESPEEIVAKYEPGGKQSDGPYMVMFTEMCTFMQIQKSGPCTKSEDEKHRKTAKKIRVVLESYEEAASK